MSVLQDNSNNVALASQSLTLRALCSICDFSAYFSSPVAQSMAELTKSTSY